MLKAQATVESTAAFDADFATFTIRAGLRSRRKRCAVDGEAWASTSARDVSHTPLPLSYALVRRMAGNLFIDHRKLSNASRDISNNRRCQGANELTPQLTNWPSRVRRSRSTADRGRCTERLIGSAAASRCAATIGEPLESGEKPPEIEGSERRISVTRWR